MQDPYQPPPLSRVERMAAFCTLVDPELLRLCHGVKRQEVVHDFIFLCAMAVLFVTVWTLTLSGFGVATWQALLVASVISLLILLFDVRMVASDTEPRGVLRNRPFSRAFYARAGGRLLVAILLNTATAVGVDIWMMRDEALAVKTREVEEANKPIRLEYEKKIATVREAEVAPLEKQRADLVTSLVEAEKALQSAKVEAAGAFNEAQTQRLETERQDEGFGDREHGHGPLAIDAARRENLARQKMEFSDLAAVSAQGNIDRLNKQLAAVDTSLESARAEFQRQVGILTLERDGRLTPISQGPMTVILGWWKLSQMPDRRFVVLLTSFFAWLTMTTLELAFFMARTFFKDASTYDERLNTRTRRDVVDLSNDFRSHVGEARRRNFRVVSDNENSAEAGEAGQDHAEQDQAANRRERE